MIRISRLRHRIELQTNTPVQTTDGSNVDDWTTVAKVWAEFLESRGREYLAAQEAHSELSAKFIIRYRPDVRPEWRIVFQERTFNIVNVADLKGRRRKQELDVAEIR